MTQNILIIGATSVIAIETARIWAQSGAQFYLLARNEERLFTIAQDLKLRGASNVEAAPWEANDFETHEAVLLQVQNTLKTIDLVFIAHGVLPEQAACERDLSEVLRAVNTNVLSILSLTFYLMPMLEKQGYGTLAVISSVAGDRGRASNYIYGASKSMLSTFLQGLRARSVQKGIHVLTIKPGPVDTPMASGMKPGFLLASPQKVARGIVQAVARKREVVYLPHFWRLIMFCVKLIPEAWFKKLQL